MRCTETCRSPVACGGWGYCRNRNNDGRGVGPVAVAARRAEEIEREAAFKKEAKFFNNVFAEFRGA